MIGGDDPRIACAYNFAHPEVRAERLAIIEEVCDRYDADGLEIDDYVRVYFKPAEVKQNTAILTDFMRDVRDPLNRIGREHGHQMCLAARVQPLEAANFAVGMDVRTWVSEKLVDLLIPSSGGQEAGFVDNSPYAEWLVEVAHEAGAWVYFRPGASPYDDRHHRATVEMYRAMSSVYRHVGQMAFTLRTCPGHTRHRSTLYCAKWGPRYWSPL